MKGESLPIPEALGGVVTDYFKYTDSQGVEQIVMATEDIPVSEIGAFTEAIKEAYKDEMGFFIIGQ